MATPSDEYNALRNEILNLFNRGVQYKQFTLVSTIAILTFAVQQENVNSSMFLIPLLIIIPNMFTDIVRAQSVMKLGAYILVFHEERDKVLFWETVNPFTRNISGRMIRENLSWIYYWLIIICMVLYFAFQDKVGIISYFAFSVGLISMVYALIISYNKQTFKNMCINEFRKRRDELIKK